MWAIQVLWHQRRLVLAVMQMITERWQCKLIGILVRCDELTDLAVERLVFQSIAKYMVPQGVNVHYKDYSVQMQ